MKHKAGFVNIIGSPNVGKSTLMNQLVGEKLSIITSKAQTTRHRIMGIVNGDDFQIVYSDTPGVLDANYGLQESMMKFVNTALKDADMILLVTDVFEDTMKHEGTLEKIKKMDIPIVVLVNKIDLGKQDQVEEKLLKWKKELPNAKVAAISALHAFNTEELFNYIVENLPESPPFFPKDEMTDKPMRFFVEEIVREKILLNYKQEVPYSCEVKVEEYKDEGERIRIRTIIYVNRDSQKGILIGHQGKMLKKVGTEARIDIQQFVGRKVYLELYVKVDKNWRDSEQKLKKYGYLS